MEGRVGPCTAGVFPLRFGGQPVGATLRTLLWPRAEPFAELNRVHPFNEFSRETRSLPLSHTRFTTAVGPSEKALPPWKHLFVFGLGHLVPTQIKRTGNGDLSRPLGRQRQRPTCPSGKRQRGYGLAPYRLNWLPLGRST